MIAKKTCRRASSFLALMVSGVLLVMVLFGEPRAAFSQDIIKDVEFKRPGNDCRTICGSEEFIMMDFWELISQSNINSYNHVINMASWTPEKHTLSLKSDRQAKDSASGLVAHYSFNGNANDESGNGNHGVVNGGVTYEQGVSGQSVRLNGTDSYIRIPNPSQKFDAQYTITAWVLTEGKGGALASKYSWNTSVARGFGLFSTSESGDVDCFTGSTFFPVTLFDSYFTLFLFPSYTMPINKFEYISAVYDGGNVKLYINGLAVSEKNVQHGNTLENSYDILIGTYFENNGTSVVANRIQRTFSGLIDELCIYNRALSESEIKELYTVASDSTSGLVAYYPLNGNADDESGNGNHGAVQGNVVFEDGIIGRTALFSGGGHIRVPSSASLSISDSFSLCAWVNPSSFYSLSIGNAVGVICKGYSIEHYGLWVLSNGMGVSINWGTNSTFSEQHTFAGDGLTTLNKWSFLSATYDGHKVRYYFNGVKQAEYDFTDQISNSDEDLYIGADYPGSAEFFNGRIDEVRIYNRALSLAEIQELYAVADSTSGLVAYYPLNGNANDESGNGNHGSENGEIEYIDGRTGQAAKFDGTDDYILVPDNDTLDLSDAMTITAWIKSESTSGPRVIVSKWNDNSWDYSYIFKDHNYSDKLRITLTKGGLRGDLGDLTGAAFIPLETWIHVAATYDSDTLRLYFNGVQDGTLSASGTIKNSATALLIGAVYTGGGIQEKFKGAIDDIRIYNRALSPAEIQEIYSNQPVTLNANFTANQTTGTAPLSVQFRDESTGNPVSWQWDFNNDSITDSQEQKPSWTYESPGTYTVSLTVRDGSNEDTEVKTSYITITEQAEEQTVNLTVSELTLPLSATSLNPPKISWQVQNKGEGDAAGSWVDRVYLSSDNFLDEGDTLLGEFARTEILSADSYYRQTQTLQIPDIAPGSYYIILKTDSTGSLEEINEDDNIAVGYITFATIKLLTAVPSRIPLNLIPGIPVTGQIELGNIGETDISGINAVVQNAAENISITMEPPSDLERLSSANIKYTIKASDDSVSKNEAIIEITSNNGGRASVIFDIAVVPARSKLMTDPGYLECGMVRGKQRMFGFELSNMGGASAEELMVLLPESSWLKLVTPEHIGTLGPGEKSKIQVMLRPSADLELGPYSGDMVISGANANLRIGFRFTAVSEAKGSVRITATDEFTYFAEDHPNVARAEVIIKDAFSGTTIAEGLTDETGVFLAPDINEARYNIEVRAEKHATYRSTIEIVPGETREVEAFLQRQLVSYKWTVEPVEIEDHYTVNLEAVFETHVPAPVVTVDPPFNFIMLLPGEESTVELTITNHGLIAAHNVTLSIPEIDTSHIEPSHLEIGTLPAMESIVIPVKLWLKESSERKGKLSDDTQVQEANKATCLPAIVDYCYYCKKGNGITETHCSNIAAMLKIVDNVLTTVNTILSIVEDPLINGTFAALEAIFPNEKDTITLIKDSLKCLVSLRKGDFAGAAFDCLSAVCSGIKAYNTLYERAKQNDPSIADENVDAKREELNKLMQCMCSAISLVSFAKATSDKMGSSTPLDDIHDVADTALGAKNTIKDAIECLCNLSISSTSGVSMVHNGPTVSEEWRLTPSGISSPGTYTESKAKCTERGQYPKPSTP